jgi:hypothetical protein
MRRDAVERYEAALRDRQSRTSECSRHGAHPDFANPIFSLIVREDSKSKRSSPAPRRKGRMHIVQAGAKEGEGYGSQVIVRYDLLGSIGTAFRNSTDRLARPHRIFRTSRHRLKVMQGFIDGKRVHLAPHALA